MTSPREARQLRQQRQPLTVAQQAEAAIQTGQHGYRVPSSSMDDCWRTVDVARAICSCPGFAVARKYKHPCRHIVAVYLKIAGELLHIEGEPESGAFDQAGRWLERG